jgi:Arc/MetJ family transcription regulator
MRGGLGGVIGVRRAERAAGNLWLSASSRMCRISCIDTHDTECGPMRTNIEIDDVLMREAQKASGHATKKRTVEEALRLMIRLRRQHEVDAAFGRYRWRGHLERSRTGRGAR